MSTALVIDEPTPIHFPARAGTLSGFRKWVTSEAAPQRRRFSYINQEIIIQMSPEELETHNKVKFEVSRTIGNMVRRIRRGTFYADGTLVTNVRAGLSTEPDGVFALWESLDSGRVRLIPRKEQEGEYTELVGTPDWVLEVVSRTSVRKDTLLLRQAYHSAGIPEYWLITAFGPEIDFQILRWRKRGYAAMPVREGWRRSPLFDCRFRLTRERDKLGYWEYTLDVE